MAKGTKKISMKSEPGGMVALGELNLEEIKILLSCVESKKMDDDLYYMRRSGNLINLRECEGVSNVGATGEIGNLGVIQLDEDGAIELPKDKVSGKLIDGVYLAYASLAKVSLEFEFTPPDGKNFESKKLVEISVPVRLPQYVNHERYGILEFNLISNFEYAGEPIEEYEHELTDNGYEELTVIIAIIDGSEFIIYHNFEGNELWPTSLATEILKKCISLKKYKKNN